MLYISSPINALLEGFYRDDITFEMLKEKGISASERSTTWTGK